MCNFCCTFAPDFVFFMHMRKILCFLCSVWLFCGTTNAFVRDTFPDINPGEHSRLEFRTEYGYNDVWGHHANFDLSAMVPIHKHFDLMVAAQFSTANVYTINVELDSKFLLTKKHHRELYFKTRFMPRMVVRAQALEFNIALGLGYRQDYVNILIGTDIRMMDELHRKRDYHMNEMIAETFYPIYFLEVFGRPMDCNWNVSARITNLNEFQIEHMWNPIFSLGGQYDPDQHWRVTARVDCKPAGMFNMTGSFFDIHGLVGFAYTF